MILVQKLDVFYGEDFVSFGYQFMLTLFVQTMGMGLAGYLRRFSVYPVKGQYLHHSGHHEGGDEPDRIMLTRSLALWPTILPTIAMNRALTRTEPRESIRAFGKIWTASR